MSGKIILRAPSGGSVALKVADTAIDTEVVVHGDSIGGGIGVNQTWRDVKASRSPGTDYGNYTGKPISIHVRSGAAAAVSISLTINGVEAGRTNVAGTNVIGQVSAIIPNGSTYRVTFNSGTLSVWSELRGD